MKKYYKYFLTIVILAAMAGCAAQGPSIRLDASLQKDIRTFDGVEYVPLIRLCDAYDLEWKWDQFTKKATLEGKGKTIVLRAGSDRILVNGLEKRMARPALLNNGVVFVPTSFVKEDIGLARYAPAIEKERALGVPGRYSIKTIVIDAGHGGKDAGAIGRRLRLREKTLNLVVAKKLKAILEEQGIRVILTRDSDNFIALSRRVDIANRSGADLFVSIHTNASRSRLLNGFECYYLSEATDDNARALEAAENASLKMDEGAVLAHSKKLDATLWDMTLTENRAESAELASRICASIEDTLAIRNKGVKTARFYVLKGTRMPAVLVEIGYISNRYEEMKLKDKNFLDRITYAVAQGILAYKKEFEKTEGYTNI